MKSFNPYLLISILLMPMRSVSQEPPPAYEREIFDNLNKFGGVPADKDDKVAGSAYWNAEWLMADLYDYEDRPYGRFLVKVNLLEQKVHFLNTVRTEQVAMEESLKRIVVRNQIDTSKILTVFQYNIPEVEQMSHRKQNLVQELNQGQIKLLKITRRKIASADSLFGTVKRYFYSDEYQYFISNGSKIEKLKRLSADFFLAHIPLGSKYKAWIRENKINFKTEADCLRFLSYYNQQEDSGK
jgi:hypothetical protein